MSIIVNGRKRTDVAEELSFEEIVRLAFDTTNPSKYTVVYRYGPKENSEGSLLRGQTARVKDGMVFNVAFTGNA